MNNAIVVTVNRAKPLGKEYDGRWIDWIGVRGIIGIYSRNRIRYLHWCDCQTEKGVMKSWRKLMSERERI